MKQEERGFTLVELLVSLAITGAAAGLLVAALGTGGQVAGRLESRAASGETVAAAQAILRDRIERLLADTGDGTGQTTQAATVGTATRLSFIAPAAGNRPGAGMQRYYLALGTDRTLDLATIDSRQKAATPAQWRIDPLVGNVAAIELAYYGMATDGQMRWQSKWVGRTDPPALVRLRLRFNDGDGRFWPELVICPAATVSTACALDFNTGTCRAS